MEQSQIARYQLTGDEEAKDMALRAADILLARFHKQGGFLRAWDTWAWDTDEKFIREKKGKVIIDSMMNIPLLFWAHSVTGKEDFYKVATTYADTLAEYIVRTDGSTVHTYNFDYETGKPIRGKTRQGYSDDSCWSRGQAWAMYGFGLAYQYTNEPRYLAIAEKRTQYFIENLDAGLMPWDFKTRHLSFRPWDSSAAAIAAAAMVQLSIVTDGEKKEAYRLMALRQIHAVTKLCGTVGIDAYELLLHGSEGSEHILTNGTTDQSLVYGDYFYFEAVMRLIAPSLKGYWF